MPIPQVQKKRNRKPTYMRDASSVRKKRAAARRSGRKPSAGKTHSTKKKRTPRSGAGGRIDQIKDLFARENIVRTLAIGGAFCVGAGLILASGMYLWFSRDLADITDLDSRVIAQSTKIYARDGQTLLYEVGDNRRIDVTIDEIDDNIEHALIALEDRRFYDHGGFDAIGLTRAVLKLIVTLDYSNAQGASTITQQFVGNAIVGRDRAITRKIKELILAIRLERNYTKDEILEFYFNDIYFGSNFQGVEAASQGFFGKSANEVTLSEAAILASMPKNSYALARDPERLKARRDYALQTMVDMDFISQEEADAALAEPIPEMNDRLDGVDSDTAHFVFHVLGELEDTYGQSMVRNDGLKVVTTLDYDKQTKAYQAIQDNIARVDQYGGSNAALVSIDTHTGQVLAMIGSRDYFDEENDGAVNVATRLRQPGSSFKPIVYLAGFEKGYLPQTKLFDVVTDFATDQGNYQPKNYDLSERGPVTIQYALSQSLNIPAVKMLYLVGVDAALDTAEALGYTSLRDRSRFGLSLVLGGAEVSLLEHVSAYATFAREGERHPVSTILEVSTYEGDVLESWELQSQQVYSADAVRTLNYALSNAAARGGGFSGLNLSDRPVAAKTGTTNDYRDAWTMGYTPSLATGVWAGNNDNTEMNRGGAGLILAAPIWKQYMDSVLTGTPVETFRTPSLTAANEALGGNIERTVEYNVDSITGELIPDSCLADYPEEYIATKELKETHTILHYIDRLNPKGGEPSNPRNDPAYEPWETAVVRWTNYEEQQGQYSTDNLPEVSCSLRNPAQQPKVSITSLEAGEEYTRNTFSIEASVTPGTNRTITEVEYIVDVVEVDSATGLSISRKRTVESDYSARTLTSGSHEITVRVTDDNGNVAEDTVSIRFSN